MPHVIRFLSIGPAPRTAPRTPGRSRWLSLLLGILAATRAWTDPTPATTSAPAVPRANPALAEVPLPARAGWQATLVLDNAGVGIWTVEAFQVFPQTATPEIVGLDDLGRLHVCSGYSGKWTPTPVISDGKWLGGLAHGDVDPRIDGAETYAGSQQGNLYQVVSWPHGILDYRLIAHLPGREIHTLVAGELNAARPGPGLLVFTRPGGLAWVTPTGQDGTFETTMLADYDGRVRQAVVLPPDSAGAPPVATVSHNGRLELLRLAAEGPRWTTLYEGAMGLGRLALRPPADGAPQVLYTTHDDGRILRHEQRSGDAWATEVIYLGPQGPRGLVAGRFGEAPETETVALFGYSRQVELLARTPQGWRAETIFEDTDKGHWLAGAELDGRNGTLELITSGYSGRMVLLSRSPGFGRTELAARPRPERLLVRDGFEHPSAERPLAGFVPGITGAGEPSWQIVSDPSAPTPASVLQQSASVADRSFPLCLLEGAAVADGFVEVRFKTVAGTNDQAAGVVFRARDAANYYVCRANALEGNVVLYRVREGQRQPLDVFGRPGGYGVNVLVSSGQWHTLRVDMDGPRFKVAYEGQPLFEVEDATFTDAGRVGLWTKADSVTRFDDFVCGTR